MKGYNVYSKIQQFRSAGFSQRQVARRLGINRKTVKRYWEMTADEYEEISGAVCRMQYLDKYQAQIIGWLREFPDMTASQVWDWLKEHYREDVSERTVSRYVKQLREEYGLKKSDAPREYEAVPELPMGRQMQVDFGQTVMPNVDGGRTKVYLAAFVLSRSRYKYTQIQSRPFTSVDLVRVCHDCFQYMGGMPAELVFDQDSIVCVSENAGGVATVWNIIRFIHWSQVMRIDSQHDCDTTKTPEISFTPTNLRSSGRNADCSFGCAVGRIRRAREKLRTR